MASITQFDIITMIVLAVTGTVFYLFHDLFTAEQRKLVIVRNIYTINLFVMILSGVISIIRIGMFAMAEAGPTSNRALNQARRKREIRQLEAQTNSSKN